MSPEARADQTILPTPEVISNSSSGGDHVSKHPRRACDCCRKRKVKCDSGAPCGPCKKASIRCAYLQAPKKKGPKGLRSARVLHALRRIDDSASTSPTSPISPQKGGFENWGWNIHGVMPCQSAGISHTDFAAIHQARDLHAPRTSAAPERQAFYQLAPIEVSCQPSAIQAPASPYKPEMLQQQGSWITPPVDSTSRLSEKLPASLSPGSQHAHYSQRSMVGETLLPYVRLFFEHMFAIMPVLDPIIYLDHALHANVALMAPEVYCLLCALCAATSAQLDESILQPPPLHPTRPSADLLVDECLRERKGFDPIETDATLRVLASFFLFAYYGNREDHARAWKYLQDSITFAQILDMEKELSYTKLEPAEREWRRRLYWLLFITERAYAVQRRKQTRLQTSIALPAAFENEDPQLLSGFVDLANLFSKVDNSFVRAWQGPGKVSFCNDAWLARTQNQLDNATQVMDPKRLKETQYLDISVTHQWLHVLAWQVGVSNGLVKSHAEGGMSLDYPVGLAKTVVEVTSRANALALNSHGIGMEQKLSDVAGCLTDVLKYTLDETSATFSDGKQYLNILLQMLSKIRGRESRYLRPLKYKIEGLLGYELGNQTLPLPDDRAQHLLVNHLQVPHQTFAPVMPTWSPTGPIDTVGQFAMNGNLNVAGHAAAHEGWQPSRQNGRIADEDDIDTALPWLGGDPSIS